MNSTDPTTPALADPRLAGEREQDLGALGHLLTFEDLDDAMDTLEQVLGFREVQREARAPYYATYADPDAAADQQLREAIDQLRTVRALHAIPAAALDAAIAAAEHADDAEDEQWELNR